MTRICVFCGSSMGNKEDYRKAAKHVGEYFVANNIGLVYGGANVGLMKIIANVVLDGGIEVIGVMPHMLIAKEVEHQKINQLIRVETMAERKEKMVEISDAFIALPGGFGTFDELLEVLTYNQLVISDKPVGILNIEGYFDKLLEFFDHAVNAGFVRKEHRNNLIVSSNINGLMKKMNEFKPIVMGKWIEDIKVESNGG
ncbi:MAG: TIGR00730 family Rossman fold protein [Bacteroidetes bacterium]|nr:TIGR00730 family Rossman fold protein [Bacteroidota bacterium]MBL6943467.1 TIGR00730 family Rossman fold protein [Bacteroidales bacterium]